ncbi:MAG: hypothetical protein HY582_05710, partial [Candidatus Omnitrophica bacterium]|nr:hypothetical protein [Candidatus Omnitrophota bacterium]
MNALVQQLKSPIGATLTFQDGKKRAVEIVADDPAQDSIEVKYLDTNAFYGDKSIERIPRNSIRTIEYDHNAETIAHTINMSHFDLVGHEAVEEWSIEALEKGDRFLAQIFETADKVGADVIITADHGNIETIEDELRRFHKQHSLEPVGIAFRQSGGELLPLEEGRDLSEVYPTEMQALDLPVPEGKNQHSLLKNKSYRTPKGTTGKRQLVLVILDGLAPIDDPTSPYNKANIPNIKALFQSPASTRLLTHGEAVGNRPPREYTAEQAIELVKKHPYEQILLPPREGKFLAPFSPQDAVHELQNPRFAGKRFKLELSGRYRIENGNVKRVSQAEGGIFLLALPFDNGQMGGSEPGHIVIGGGEVPLQMIPFLDQLIDSGDFFDPEKNKALIGWIRKLKAAGVQVHLKGILQDAGVHSSVEHLYALLKLLKQEGFPKEKVFIHVRTDGRDEATDYGIIRLEHLLDEIAKLGYGQVVDIGPRFNLERNPPQAGEVYRFPEIEYNILVNGTTETPLVQSPRSELRTVVVAGLLTEGLNLFGVTLYVVASVYGAISDAMARSKIRAIGEKGNKSEIEPLIERLSHSSRSVRMAIFEALERLGATQEQMIGAWFKVLENSGLDQPEEKGVRKEATENLKKLGATKEQMIKGWSEVLKSPYRNTRQEAAENLRNLGASEEQLIGAWVNALGSDNGDARKEAAKTLSVLAGETTFMQESILQQLRVALEKSEGDFRKFIIRLGSRETAKAVIEATIKIDKDAAVSMLDRVLNTELTIKRDGVDYLFGALGITATVATFFPSAMSSRALKLILKAYKKVGFAIPPVINNYPSQRKVFYNE